MTQLTPLADANAVHAEASRRAATIRHCLRCGKAVPVRPSVDKQFAYCGEFCYARAQTRVRPWNRLQRRCFEYMDRHRLTIKAFAAASGINYGTFRSWLKVQGSTTSSAGIAGIAAVLGISPEQALREAGGTTAEETHAAGVHPRGTQPAWLATKTARANQADSRRGKRKAPETGERISTALKARPDVIEAVRARAQAWSHSLRGKSVLALTQFLRGTPSPSRQQLEDRAARTAEALTENGEDGAVRQQDVWTYWRPYLQRRGLIAKGGRPRNDQRLARYLELRASWGTKRDGRAKDGLVPAFQKLVYKTEGVRLTVEAVKQWVAENAPRSNARVG